MDLTILVVDDSATARFVIQDVLTSAGFHVITASGGEEGLRTYAEQRPDLVILDIRMPDLDGLEVCRRIRAGETGREVPILFLTADERPETQDLAIQAEGDDLILKQALKRELAIRVRSLLRLRGLQKELQSERDALKEAQHQKAMLTRFIVHDLKTPLQAILLSSDLLEEQIRSGEPWEPLTDVIREGGRTMIRMVQDILDIEQLESGKLLLRPEPIHLAALAMECERDLRSQLDRNQQTLAMTIPSDLRWTGDANLLQRCLLNLLGNASKYGPRGAQIDLVIRKVDQAIQVRVLDQGQGIPDTMKARIFDPFVRLERDARQARVSSGLGLTFCRVIAEAHRGRIWVEDNLPAGAAFCMELPLAPS